MFEFKRISALFGTVIYGLFSFALLLISLAMVGFGAWDVWLALEAGHGVIDKLLDAIGLIVIAIAVFDVSKYLLEEEVLRARELRSMREARQTLTKFLVIISIAVMLEALVFIFGAGREHVNNLLYPTLLLVASVFLVIGLALFLWLSADIEADGRDA